MNPRRIRLSLVGLFFLFIVAALVFPLTGGAPFDTNARAQTRNPRAQANPSRPLPNYDAFAEGRGRNGAAARNANPDDASPRVEGGRPVQYEPRLGVPTFLWASRPGRARASAAQDAQQRRQDAASAAREHLGGHASLYRLSDAEVAVAKLAGVHDTGRGPVIVKFRQEIGGVEVFRDEVNVVMDRDLRLVAITGYLTGDEAGASLPAEGFALQPAEALSKALEDLTGTALSPAALRGRRPEPAAGEAENPYILYTAEGGAAQSLAFSNEPSRVKKVMYHLVDGHVPAYYVETFVMVPSQDPSVISATGEAHLTEVAYSYVVSAVDGQVLFRNNLITHDGEFTYRVWGDPVTKLPHDSPAGNGPHPKVAPLPDGAQAPFVSTSDVTLRNFPFSRNDPWLPPGATETNGNNVDAYLNLFNPDGLGNPVTTTPADPPNGDYRAQLTAAGQFLHTHTPDVDASSASARQGAIVQLFYNINFLHDWFYDSGFDEASGNAQKDNYGRGGLGSDDIKAQAQDVAGFNNANMLTPSDGARPRMRMYMFPALANHLEVQSPAGIAAKRSIGISMSGPQSYDITQGIVRATFSNTPSSCALTNAADLAGKLALFDFDNTDGTGCSFSTRIARITAGSAAAGIIMVYTAGAPAVVANITGFVAANTKPVAVVSWNSGQTIKGALASEAVTARLLRVADRDGSLDNQIVAHEWGHYISNRLVGNANGLHNQQGGGLGEGWGDFLAMLLTVRPDDASTPSNATWNGAYAIATYATSGAPFSGALNHGYYRGIRRTPYSTDMTNYNALTFKHIQDGVPLPSGPPIATTASPNSQVHNTGEVWATMLWECYAALLRDTQGASPRLTFSEAQTRMKNYLVASLKMTPPSPTLLEARDAVIASAFAYDYQDGLLFSQAFAKRGAGVNAAGPDRFSLNNATVTESYDVGGALSFVSATLDDSVYTCNADGYLDNGERGLLKVTLKNAGFQNLLNTTAAVSSDNPHVSFPDGTTINFTPTRPGESVTASIAVAAAGASGLETSDFTIIFQDTGTPAVAPVTAHLFEYLNAEDAANSSATDDVEARQTAWAVSSDAALLSTPASRWRRAGGSASINHFWHGPSPAAASDQYLTSPVMTVGAGGSVTLQFAHSWSFEYDATADYDGGVVEYSVNGGAWADAFAGAGGVSNGYNGVLTNYSGNLNPLRTRNAFVKSSGTANSSLTRTIAAGSTVQFRFRLGSDNAVGADGWKVDNIAFGGIVETPFHVLVAESSACQPQGPTILLSPGTLPAATAGGPYAALLTPSGGTAPYTFKVAPVVLPEGLSSSVVGGSLRISGTPARAGTSLINVTATDSNGQKGGTTYALTVGKGSSTTTVTVGDAAFDGGPHGGTATASGFGGLNQSLTVTYSGRNSTVYGPSTTAPTNVGEYVASASFAGDADHDGSSDSKNFQITKASQSINFAALSDKTFGDPALTVSATGGASGNPVTFAAAGNCTSGGVNGATITISGAGSCTVTASQAGNANYAAAADAARTFQIAKADTGTALSSSANPSDLGQSVTFTATVTSSAGTPAGTVTFKDGANTLGTGTLNGSGVATFTTSALSAGAHAVTAEYGGAANYLSGAGSLSGGQTVKSAPSLSVGDVTLSEGDSGTQDAVFTVSLSAASSLTVTATFATSDGTAAAPADYQAAGGSLTFAPGETLKTFTVKVKGDVQHEPDETFLATLSGPVNATLGGTGQGTGNVVNDDAAGGVLRFSAAGYSVAEGAGSVVITVERGGDTSAAASVDYETDDGSVPAVPVPCSSTTGAALARCDFTAAAGRLDFAAGESSKTFGVLVSDDSYAEGPETLQLVLRNSTGGAVLGTPGAATLTITDDDTVSAGNPLDGSEAFVRQHYHDFLNRVPDTQGLQFWTREINSCGTDAACVETKRVNVSAAFFLSIEFQNTGYLVYRANVAAFGPTRVGGAVPVTSGEFLPDVRQMGQGVVVGAAGWEARLEANKQAYFREFVGRPAFTAAFPSTLTPAQFVAALDANAGGVLSQAESDALVAELTAGNNDDGRASVLRKVADDAGLRDAHFNRAFVLMQYFGYLRRDPNAAPDTNFSGYNFWLGKLDQFGGNFVEAEMVRAFISSGEYRQRLGQ